MSTSKIALVTGGSRGLGKDMALKLAQQGTDVILTYRSQQAEAAAVVAAIAATLTYDPANFTKFFKRFSNASTPKQYREQVRAEQREAAEMPA